LKCAGLSWEIKEFPSAFTEEGLAADFTIYAEHGNNRIIEFFFLDKEKEWVFQVEFNYVKDIDQLDSLISQAKRMINSFETD